MHFQDHPVQTASGFLLMGHEKKFNGSQTALKGNKENNISE